MVTTALRRKETAPHSACLELIVHEHSDITKVKGSLTGRASSSLEEVKLDLSDFFRVNKPLKKLRNLFKALGDLPYLKTLRFHYGAATLQRLPVQLLTIALSQALGTLEALELNNVNLTGSEEEFEDFEHLLQNHSSLQAFSFCSSGCSSASSISKILSALSETPRLEKLVIYSEGRSPWGKLTGDAVGMICRSSTLRDLQHLVLYESTSALGMGNFFTDEHTVAVAQQLSDSSDGKNILKHRPSSQLEELMLSCWPLGKAGGSALSDMLRVNKTLRKLSIVVYELEEGDDASIIDGIAKALQFNDTLEVLELHGRSEKWPEEAFAFLETMQTNYSLKRLKLFSDNSFVKPGIDFYLKLNYAGRGKLLRNANSTKEQWVQALVDVRHDLSCVFYFLSTNPLLVEI